MERFQAALTVSLVLFNAIFTKPPPPALANRVLALAQTRFQLTNIKRIMERGLNSIPLRRPWWSSKSAYQRYPLRVRKVTWLTKCQIGTLRA